MYPVTKQLIEEYIDLIDQNRFGDLYDILASENNHVWSCIGDFTQSLLHVGINPLQHLSYVPEFYLSRTDITTFTVPRHINRLLDSAFDSCEQLKSVLLPNGLQIISEFAFDSCFSLETINMPSSVRAIGKGAFSATGFKQFKFPNVQVLCQDVLSGCSQLTTVSIPNTVQLIEDHALEDNKLLNQIVFNGTHKEWNDIDKEPHWCRNTPLENIICTDEVLKVGRL